MILRAVGVEAKTELENTVSTVELSEMIAESLSEGLLDPEEHNRLSRALQIRNRVVADVAVPLSEVHAVPRGRRAVPARRWRRSSSALADTGYSRFPVVDLFGRFIGYVHIKDVLPLVDDPDAVVDLAVVRPLPQVPESMPLPDALSRLRRDNSHLAWSPAPTAACRRWWRWRTWSRTSSVPFATGLTVAELVLARARLARPRADTPEPGGRLLCASSQASAGR